MIILILLLSATAHATEAYFKYGAGALGKTESSQVFGVGVEGPLFSRFIYQGELGVLKTPSNDTPIPAYGFLGAGVRISQPSYFAAVVWGAGGISRTDSYLGGHFQFSQDATIGLTDGRNSLGLGYKHISSAGISRPNLGRDYVYLRIGTKF